MFQPSASISVMAGGRTPLNGKRLGEKMSKKICGLFALLAIFGMASFLVSCGSSSSRPSDVLYVLSQGEKNVGYFAIDLSNGRLSLINKTAKTDSTPSSIVLDPNGTAAYVLNTGSNTITSYTVGSDGSLSEPTSTPIPVSNAVAMARDAAGTFLVVVSQGAIPPPPGATPCPQAQPNPDCPALVVFTTQPGSATFTQAGDPFQLDRVPTSASTSLTGTFNDPKNAGMTVTGTLVQMTANFDLVGNVSNTISEYVVQTDGSIVGPLTG